MKINVNRAKCQGHAMCFANGPDVYPLDDLGYTALDGEVEVPDSLAEQARRGALVCPERVITIVGE